MEALSAEMAAVTRDASAALVLGHERFKIVTDFYGHPRATSF